MRNLWWKWTLKPGWYDVVSASGRMWKLEWDGSTWRSNTVVYHPKLIGYILGGCDNPKPKLNIGGL